MIHDDEYSFLYVIVLGAHGVELLWCLELQLCEGYLL